MSCTAAGCDVNRHCDAEAEVSTLVAVVGWCCKQRKRKYGQEPRLKREESSERVKGRWGWQTQGEEKEWEDGK